MMEKLEASASAPGCSRPFQHPAAGGGAGPSVAGVEPISAHGRTCDPVAECMQGQTTFFLTGGSETPPPSGAQLAAEGFGDVQGVVGQCLGTPEEKLFRGSVKGAGRRPLQQPERPSRGGGGGTARRAPGLPDEAFERGDVPMTKQEVRAAVLAKLAVRPEDILWDVGAGTGSVSVELALAAPRGPGLRGGVQAGGAVRSSKPTAKNSGPGTRPRGGLAPAALSDLPAPDAALHRRQQGALLPSWTPRWIRTPTPASVCRPSPLRPFRRRWPR